MQTEYLWVEKYRPHRVADTVLPAWLKDSFQKFVDEGSVPNLLLVGSSGVGKTTVAEGMLEELGLEYMKINASLHGNIDTLRNDISSFASAVSLTGGRKYVLLDEADWLTSGTQPALRAFIEEFSSNCGFILTCNYQDRLMKELRSRFVVVQFRIDKSDRADVLKGYYVRAAEILRNEGVEFEREALAGLVKRHFPDFRKTLGDLQFYSRSRGKIDSGILAKTSTSSIDELVSFLKEKAFTKMRKWVAENPDSSNEVFRELYERADSVAVKDSVPVLLLALGEWQYKAAFAADQEINLAAFLTQVMADCEFL